MHYSWLPGFDGVPYKSSLHSFHAICTIAGYPVSMGFPVSPPCTHSMPYALGGYPVSMGFPVPISPPCTHSMPYALGGYPVSMGFPISPPSLIPCHMH